MRKIFLHYIDIAIFALGYFILPHPVGLEGHQLPMPAKFGGRCQLPCLQNDINTKNLKSFIIVKAHFSMTHLKQQKSLGFF